MERQQTIELAIVDVRMPVMDGLSALVCLKNSFPTIKVVLLSAESVKSYRAGKGMSDVDDTKKIEMLEKIATRLRIGGQAEGKINSMLEGCEKLVMDPVAVAAHFWCGRVY